MKNLSKILAFFILLFPCLVNAQQQISIVQGSGWSFSLPRDAASIFVTNPAVADIETPSERLVYLSAISPGTTSIIATDYQDQTIANYTVTVLPQNADASAVLGNGLSIQENGNVAIIRGNATSVSGAQSVEAARSVLEANGRTVVDQTTFGDATQISLRVRFVEASRNDLEQLGLNISALGTIGGDVFRLATGGDLSTFIDGTSNLTGPGIGGRYTRGAFSLDGLLEALESKGLIQILSEPTLTTVSGKRATFTAGGEIAYPVSQGDGVVTAEFKSYGVTIDFLPVLLDNDRISIQLKPEVSFVDADASVTTDGFSAPGLSVRRAETTVEIGSGQTFAIAGLYEQYSQNRQSGVPGLSELLGRSTKIRRERELIIFITPYLTKPADVATPRLQDQNFAGSVGFITK